MANQIAMRWQCRRDIPPAECWPCQRFPWMACFGRPLRTCRSLLDRLRLPPRARRLGRLMAHGMGAPPSHLAIAAGVGGCWKHLL